jgi:hypothetical protein
MFDLDWITLRTYHTHKLQIASSSSSSSSSWTALKMASNHSATYTGNYTTTNNNNNNNKTTTHQDVPPPSFYTLVRTMLCDWMTVWLGRSDLKGWIKVWLGFLLVATVCPIVFVPHPFATANIVGIFVILILNGHELIRLRGFAKNMGWPHLVAWIPVLIIDVLCLTTDTIRGGQLTWDNAGDSPYQKARFVILWYNLVALSISCIFDVNDTVMYYCYDVTRVDRSEWTKKQLQQQQQEVEDKNVVTDQSGIVDV